MFMKLLSGLVNGSNHKKCALLRNQKRMIQPLLITLHSNEYSRELHYYPFEVNLDRCVRSCNILMTYLIKYMFQTKQKVYD